MAKSPLAAVRPQKQQDDQPVRKIKSRSKSYPTPLLLSALLQAATHAGDELGSEGLVSYLKHQALKNPNPFMTLLGKALPYQAEEDKADNSKIEKIELIPLCPHEIKKP